MGPTRRAAATALGAMLCSCAFAQGGAPAGRFVLLSHVGDRLSIDVYRQRTGTVVDRNDTRTIPVAGTVLDQAALVALDDRLREDFPGVEVAMLPVPESGSALDPARLLANGRIDPDTPLASDLRAKGFTQLLVVAKLRAEARLRLRDGYVGSGRIEGLGFYVDPALETRNRETHREGVGFVAPYVYVKLQRVDLKTGAVVREVPVMRSTSRSASDSESGIDPWKSMTTQEKFDVLLRLLREGVREAVPQLFSAG